MRLKRWLVADAREHLAQTKSAPRHGMAGTGDRPGKSGPRKGVPEQSSGTRGMSPFPPLFRPSVIPEERNVAVRASGARSESHALSDYRYRRLATEVESPSSTSNDAGWRSKTCSYRDCHGRVIGGRNRGGICTSRVGPRRSRGGAGVGRGWRRSGQQACGRGRAWVGPWAMGTAGAPVPDDGNGASERSSLKYYAKVKGALSRSFSIFSILLVIISDNEGQ
jgi:hypothetical protein